MGGGTFRTAAKLAGIAATNGGFRASSTVRKAGYARPPSAPAEELKVMTSKSESGVQRSCSGIDDWELAGGVEDQLVASAGEPIPRVVFGGVPSLDEAKEATSELSVALEKAYLSSSHSVGDEGSVVADNNSSLSISNKQVIETKACVPSEVAVPAPAIMAFKFLHESSMAQNVVASIASDPNVWNAVLQNQELQDFLQSQRECSFSDENLNMKLVTDSDLLDYSSPKSIDDGSPDPNDKGYMEFFLKIKSTVVDMMSNLSGYFQSFFGGKGANGVFINSDGSARLSGETLIEASFMGLAVMAIVVILLKRT